MRRHELVAAVYIGGCDLLDKSLSHKSSIHHATHNAVVAAAAAAAAVTTTILLPLFITT